MADKFYSGSSGWNTNGNWSPVNIPVSNDRVFFRDTNTNNCTAGMNQGGIDLDLIDTDKNYSGVIGANGSPLLIACDLIDLKGSGSFFVEADANSAGLKIDEIRIQPVNINATIEIGSNPLDAGDIDKIIALSGNITTSGTTVFGASAIVEVGYKNSVSSDVTFTLGSSNTLPTLDVWGGSVTSSGVITNARVHNADFIKTDTHCVNLDLYNSNCKWNDASESANGITIRVMAGSTLTLKNSLPMTISTIWLYPGSDIIYDDTIHTITTLNDLRGKR